MNCSLKEHLKRYGIFEMDREKYWNWGGKKLGERKSTRLNILREPIVKGYATEEDYLNLLNIYQTQKWLQLFTL